MRTAIAACQTCNMPVRVRFGENGEVLEVIAVCEHVQVIPEKHGDRMKARVERS